MGLSSPLTDLPQGTRNERTGPMPDEQETQAPEVVEAVDPERSALNVLWRKCQIITTVGNEIVPKHYWGRPEAALSAVLMGRELGLGDMLSLQRVYVVDGKVVLAAELIRGLIRKAGHSLTYTERTDARCTIHGTRADTGDVLDVTWTMEDAIRAGVAAKEHWVTHPRAMLDARATTEIARALFSDCVGWATLAPEDMTGTPDAY